MAWAKMPRMSSTSRVFFSMAAPCAFCRLMLLMFVRSPGPDMLLPEMPRMDFPIRPRCFADSDLSGNELQGTIRPLAILFPHGSVGFLHVLDIGNRIACRRSRDPRTKISPYFSEAIGHGRIFHRDVRIAVAAVVHPFTHADPRQNSARQSAGHAVSQLGNDRYPHVQCFPGADTSVLRKRIQTNVHIPVCQEMLLAGGGADEVDSILRNPAAGKWRAQQGRNPISLRVLALCSPYT